MKYDGFTQKLVLFGGSGQSCTTSKGVTTCTAKDLNDTWTWDGAQWKQQAPTTSPPVRDAYGMAFDGTSQKIVILGGEYFTCSTQNCQVLLGDTWSWDGTTWKQEQPQASPSPRVYPQMDWDIRNGQIILFGAGQAFTSVNPTATDTWSWSHSN
jgi:hypothetical protein